MVCLPIISAISLLVEFDLPPRNRVESQQSTMVCAFLSYFDSSCDMDCRMMVMPMLRERVTAMVSSICGMVPIFANSSKMKWTGVGSLPP